MLKASWTHFFTFVPLDLTGSGYFQVLGLFFFCGTQKEMQNDQAVSVSDT